MDKSYHSQRDRSSQEEPAGTKTTRLYAVVAPSISSQFTYAKLGQVITGLKQLGFHTVVEAALGADMVAQAESKELAEKGFLTSSCCPAFVTYIEKTFPQLAAVYFAQPLADGDDREIHQGDRRRTQRRSSSVPAPPRRWRFSARRSSPYVDAVLTFEELQALFDSQRHGHHYAGGGRAGQRLLLTDASLPAAAACPTRWPKRLKEQGHRRLHAQGMLLRRHRGMPHGAAEKEQERSGRATSSKAWPASAAASAAPAA